MNSENIIIQAETEEIISIDRLCDQIGSDEYYVKEAEEGLSEMDFEE